MRDSIIISLLGLIQAIFSFVYVVLIANLFGIGSDLDVFFASSTVNIILVAIASSSIKSAITPLLIKHYKVGDYDALKTLANSFCNSLFLIFFLLALIQYYFAEPILKLILPGFGEDKIGQTVFFFRVHSFISILTISTALLIALNYTQRKYYRTVIIPIFGLLLQILTIYLLYGLTGINSLIYGVAVNQVFVFLVLAIPYIKHYRLKVVLDTNMKDAAKKIYPLILSSGFSKSNIMVDRFFASTLAAGSITFLQYGQKIIDVISNFINKGISVVSLRSFSMESGNDRKFHMQFVMVYKSMIFLIIPVVVMMTFFMRDALQILLISERISQNDLNNLYWVIIALFGMLVGGTLSGPIANAFYAKGLTHVISRVSIVLQIFGISIKVGLFYVFGFWGLPIAFSITSFSTTIVLLYMYNSKIHKVFSVEIVKYFIKVALIALFSIIVPKYISLILSDWWYINLTVGVILFLFFYSATSLLFEKDVSMLISKRLFTT